MSWTKKKVQRRAKARGRRRRSEKTNFVERCMHLSMITSQGERWSGKAKIAVGLVALRMVATGDAGSTSDPEDILVELALVVG